MHRLIQRTQFAWLSVRIMDRRIRFLVRFLAKDASESDNLHHRVKFRVCQMRNIFWQNWNLTLMSDTLCIGFLPPPLIHHKATTYDLGSITHRYPYILAKVLEHQTRAPKTRETHRFLQTRNSGLITVAYRCLAGLVPDNYWTLCSENKAKL